jgi:hypothetical protein
VSDVPPPPGSDQPTGAGEPAPPNPYGAPQPPPYGQPAPGQPPAGPPYPAYGQVPGEKKPGKGLAITSLVLAFIPCIITNLVSLVLAIVVLVGKKGGKGLAIAAIVINILVLVGWGALIALGVVLAGTPIDDLKDGQCFTAEGLTGDDDGVSQIEVVGCTKSHDAEVLAVKTLTGDEADAYKEQSGGEACGPLIDTDVIAALPEEVTVTALTQSEEPGSGDHLACVAYRTDGKSLTEKLG